MAGGTRFDEIVKIRRFGLQLGSRQVVEQNLSISIVEAVHQSFRSGLDRHHAIAMLQMANDDKRSGFAFRDLNGGWRRRR